MIQTIGRVGVLSALDVELAAANLALYVQMTPVEEIQVDEVLAEFDRLDKLRAEVVDH